MTILHLGIPYAHAKQMTDAQINSLVHWDHNILHETGHPDRDRAFNLTPMPIKAHREKTKRDAKVIAKGRRLRQNPVLLIADALSAGFNEGMRKAFNRIMEEEKRPRRKIPSRVNPWPPKGSRKLRRGEARHGLAGLGGARQGRDTNDND